MPRMTNKQYMTMHEPSQLDIAAMVTRTLKGKRHGRSAESVYLMLADGVRVRVSSHYAVCKRSDAHIDVLVSPNRDGDAWTYRVEGKLVAKGSERHEPPMPQILDAVSKEVSRVIEEREYA